MVRTFCRRLRHLPAAVSGGRRTSLVIIVLPDNYRHSSRNFSSSSNTSTFDFTDLTRPHTWYPIARKKKRNVFLHVGPTNSGKTYHALKRLECSSSGVYCGPLRLLAWEVAKRMNKANVPCDLITGQEREVVEGSKHIAVTVEMADVTTDYKCAVVDEIQMLGCKTRGFSFTRALLGLAADELHLCGDPAAVPLIQEILKVTGDNVKIEYYDRLLPLVPLNVPLGSFSNIKEGDCLVSFSRRGIYDFKRRIESAGQHLCSVVYGSLPPETRTRQATLFNDAASELNVLVASDAIGMGLNLNISRIIFSSLKKFDGLETRDLTVPEIKQIAGRAGRYGSKYPVGEVTCLEAEDLPLLHSSLNCPSPELERAGLFPSYDLLLMYSRANPKNGLYHILEHFSTNSKLSSSYFISDCEQLLKVAAIIDELPLGLHEKYIFSISPVDVDDDISSQGLVQFAQTYAKKGLVHLKEIFTPGTLKVPTSPTALKALESIHKVLELYVWLGYRLEDSFPDRELAASQKSICSMLIEEFLVQHGWQQPKPRLVTEKPSIASHRNRRIK
ncbi:ATP-dependent RNA helicase SUV3, mitochondrial [Silene latifolia]|uniref:ATP-dependent RNA helicase SUV3, mitochondrial n=1 Tax=Silene latifolia TaxID=37657 RepID=UPI003D788E77